MSTVLRDVGPSLVGGWVLPHEGTILQKHIRHAGEPGCCIGDRILTFLLMNPSALLAREHVCVMCFVHFIS